MKHFMLCAVLFIRAMAFSQAEEATILSLEQKEFASRESLPLTATRLPEETVPPATPVPGGEGVASWYGGKFQGRKTASGEVFDTRQFTAAHRTLPFNTRVRVTNLDNGKSTIVRVNDRGPFVDNRLIDLSQAAAVELDMMKTGVARVRIDVLDSPAVTRTARATDVFYRIQAGSFRDEENARKLKERVAHKGFAVVIENTAFHVRVHVDRVAQADIENVKAALAAFGVTRPIVRRID